MGMKAMPHLLVFIAVLVSSCKGPVEPDYESDEERIIGSWSLERMINGWTGREWIPASEGYIVIWHFSDDQVLRHWLDDSLMGTTDYRLDTYARLEGTEAVPVLFRGGHRYSGYSFDTDDMLVLDQGAIGIIHGSLLEFSRIPLKP